MGEQESLISELRALFQEILDDARNPGLWSPIVVDRTIDRIEEKAAIGIAKADAALAV